MHYDFVFVMFLIATFPVCFFLELHFSKIKFVNSVFYFNLHKNSIKIS